MSNMSLQSTLESVGGNVCTLRRKRGLTQEKLATAANLDLRYVQRVERAQTNLSIGVLVALAGALGAQPTDFLKPAKLSPARPGRPKQ